MHEGQDEEGASHFDCIGFDVPDSDSFDRLVDRACEEGRSIQTASGQYVAWSAGGGAELWVQVQDGEILGANPHFTGEGRVLVALAGLLPCPESRMDGALHVWAAPSIPDDPESGYYNFVADSPEFLTVLEKHPVPSGMTLQVAAFAHGIDCFPDEAAYEEAERQHLPQYSSRSFIPTGTFDADGTGMIAEAFFTGHILKAERRINGSSGLPFWWLLLDSLEGTFDIVAAPKSLREEPRVGGIAQGNFWLSSRIIESP